MASSEPSSRARPSWFFFLLGIFTAYPMGIDQKSQTDHVAVPAGEFQTVAAPAQVRAHHDDFAVMVSLEPVKAGSSMSGSSDTPMALAELWSLHTKRSKHAA
jgi:hypothetical protein